MDKAYLKMVLAVDGSEFGAIGKDGGLVIKDKYDMAAFVEQTKGAIVLMGSKTARSLGKPLKGRYNISIGGTQVAGFECIPTVLDALGRANDLATAEDGPWKGRKVCLIGGATLYSSMLPLCRDVHLTRFEEVAEVADTFLGQDFFETLKSDYEILEERDVYGENNRKMTFQHYQNQSTPCIAQILEEATQITSAPPEVSNFEKVLEFHDVFGHPINEAPVIPDIKAIKLRLNLILEEARELVEAVANKTENAEFLNRTVYLVEAAQKSVWAALDYEFKNVDLIKVADALSDILYVTYGAGLVFGLPLNATFDEVHSSNMSKLDENGKPIYNPETGKIVKGPNYRDPDLSFIFPTKEATV